MKKKITKKKQEELKAPEFNTKIDNCQFYGVKWDATSIEVLKIVATGLVNLTEVFKNQKIEINTLLKVGKDENVSIGDSIFTN